MGQCPVSTDYATFSLDEEEFSVTATQSNFLSACNVGLQSTLDRYNARAPTHVVKNGNDDDTDVRRTFLKIHRPDIYQRCLIDPDEVKKILSQQADELLRRRGLIPTPEKTNHDDRAESNTSNALTRSLSDDFGDNNSRFDGVFSESGFTSEYGAVSTVSGVTTATRSTILTANIKPTPRPSASGSSRWKSRAGTADETSFGGIHSSSASALDSLAEQDEDDSDQQEDHNDDVSNDFVSDGEWLLANAATKIKFQAGACHFPVPTPPKSLLGRLVDHKKNEVDMRRNQYMSVLRLKVTANLGPYFTQRYLTMFPDRPKPFGFQHGTPRRDESTPDLTSTSSDSSTSSANSRLIDYGAIPPATPVKCSVTDETFLDLVITGNLGLVPRDRVGGRLSGRSHLHPKGGNQKSPDHYIVLINRRSGFPLAICAMKAASGNPVVRIYASRQRVFGQNPAATTRQLGLDWTDDLPLFAWAEVVSHGELIHEMAFSVYMANGSDGRFSAQPSYEASFHGAGHPIMKVSGKTDMERTFSGCALISMGVDPTGIGGNNGSDNVSFNIDLAQGIDPALMICFTAIIDEVMEKSMRTQCKNHARRRILKAYSSRAKNRMDGEKTR